MIENFKQNGGQQQDAQARSIPDSTPIHQLVQKTRRWLRSSWVTTGLGLTVGLFLIVLLSVSLTDLAMTLWPSMRLVGLLLIAVPVTTAFIVGVIRPLLRRMTAVIVARRIEQEIPGIHNRLVSCVDLSKNEHGQFHSKAFHHRLVSEAIERIREFRFQKVLDLVSLQRAGVLVGTSALVFVLVYVTFSGRLPTAMARIFQPFADIPPATGVLYDVLVGDQTKTGDSETLRGENVVFSVILRKGEVDPPGGDDPLRLKVNTVDSGGKPKTLWYQFSKLQDQKTFFRLTGMQDSFTYRVYGGGTWTKLAKVTMLDRPSIVGLQTVLNYPEYMKISEPILGLPQTVDVTGPEESKVTVIVEAEGDAVEGEVQLLQETTKLVDVLDRPARVWFHDEIPQGAKFDGKWEWDEKLLSQKMHSDPTSKAVHSHGFHSAAVGFEVLTSEVLFADVYLLPDQLPETIMLKWHDGKDWEHRAYWGADKIQEGKPETASRLQMGDLPPVGKLIRLEIPAQSLDLHGKRLHGISLAAFGGKCAWGAVGTMPAAQKEVTELVVEEAFLLKQLKAESPDAKPDQQKWSGSFPLLKNGYYRVELRNKLKYPNRQMAEGKLTAIVDEPPQVVINRPQVDLLLSAPIKVPIYLSAYDDYGLDQIVLSVQKNESSSFQGRPVKQFDQPQRNATAVVTLDLSQEKIKVGETLRYRIEVRDTKGQNATTKDYTIRLADDNKAADRQLAQFQKKTETFQEKLEKLITDQAHVQEDVAELNEKFQPLTEKIEQAKLQAAEDLAEADPKNPKDPELLAPEEIAKAMKLDPEATKELQELQKELTEIAKQENQNTQLAQQVANELKQLADQAPKLEILPEEVAKQLEVVQNSFDQLAVKPIQKLNEMIKQGAQPAQKDPQLAKVEQQTDKVQQNLSDLEERVQALTKAQKQSQDNVEKALADLKKDLDKQTAKMTVRELAELKEFVKSQREDLKDVKKEQAELLEDSSKDLSDRLYEKLEEAQQAVGQESDKELAETRKLLDSKELKELRRQIDENVESKTFPTKDEPQPKNDKKTAGDQDASKPLDNSSEPSKFTPVLGGPAPKLDPKISQKMQEYTEAKKAKQKAKDSKNPDTETEKNSRDELIEQQLNNVGNLDLAEKALGADQAVIEELMKKLQAAAADLEQPDQLAELLKSSDLREAQAMRQRMEELAVQQQASVSTLSENERGLLKPDPDGTELILIELEDLDLNAKKMILKMQPRVREELLQGLREQGPEGYRKFIREYFRRLTKVKTNKKIKVK